MGNASPKSLDDLATSNYFNVVASVDLDYLNLNVTTKESYGKRYHIVPSKVVVNKDVLLLKKQHTTLQNHNRIGRPSYPCGGSGGFINGGCEDVPVTCSTG
uniref:AlNc14C35G3124 protein n=1 Tax=Albugo laibachii Nc14 TaxID=890382 RepID=F0W8J8_9STRA|nr:AlNc14C35G3124 [Albugo laibachii Nc14]|eukprot:CCA17453.1 AlNc14C35G3124 [Albugo laibachii Nc14]